MTDRIWLVWSNKPGRWRKPGSMGYAAEIWLAGRYTEKEADEICEDANRCLPKGEVNEVKVLSPEGEQLFSNLVADAIALFRSGRASDWKGAKSWVDDVFNLRDKWEFKK